MRLGPRVAIFLLFAGSARAQTPGSAFSLEYSAPARCPGRNDYLAAVVARSEDAHEVSPSNARLIVQIGIEDRGTRVAGRLLLRLPDGQQSLREIPEASCDEVISSMAVITAMVLDAGTLDAGTLDPGTLDAGTLDTTSARPAGEGEPSPAHQVDGASALTRPYRPPSTDRAAPDSSRSVDGLGRVARSTSGPLAVRHLRARGVLQVGAETAVAPTAALGLATGFDLMLEGWAPSVRLAATWAAAGQARTPSGSADFRRIGLELSVCPVRWSVPHRMNVVLCAAGALGQLSATGQIADDQRTQRMLWLGLGPSARAEMAVSSWMSVELQVAIKALARHDRFLFEPNEEVHDVPGAALALHLGLALGAP